MDARDRSIAAQACVKAACELFAGSQAPGNALEAAMTFFEWVQSVAPASAPSATGGGAAPKPVAPSPTPNFQDPVPSSCPKCNGALWDNRATKKGNQPDFKCKDRACGKGIWLEPYRP